MLNQQLGVFVILVMISVMFVGCKHKDLDSSMLQSESVVWDGKCIRTDAGQGVISTVAIWGRPDTGAREVMWLTAGSAISSSAGIIEENAVLYACADGSPLGKVSKAVVTGIVDLAVISPNERIGRTRPRLTYTSALVGDRGRRVENHGLTKAPVVLEEVEFSGEYTIDGLSTKRAIRQLLIKPWEDFDRRQFSSYAGATIRMNGELVGIIRG